MEIERKVLVGYICDTSSVKPFQKALQDYLDNGWQVEHTEHTDRAVVAFFYRIKDTGVEEESMDNSLNESAYENTKRYL